MSGRLAESYVFPASFAQQRMWFLCQLNPEAHRTYHMSGEFEVDGELDLEVLREALAVLVARHEILRTRFVLFDEDDERFGGRLCQVIEPTGEIPLDETDEPFELDRLPLLRMRLSGRVLRLDAHHIICDGWSLAVFFDELAECYRAITGGRSPDLPELPIQYADFSEWQREQAARLDLAFWRDRLAGVPSLALPTDRPRPERQSFRGGRVDVHLPPVLTRRVADLAAQERATTFMVLLAAFEALLARRSGQADFAVGTPVAGRGMPEVERSIGLFVNTVVLRADIDGDPTFRELVRRVRDTSLDSFSHQDAPFEQVVEQVAPDRSRSLFHVFFAVQNTPAPVVDLPGARLTPRDVPRDTAMFDLRLALRPDGDAMSGWLEYNSDLFDLPTAQRIAAEWLDVVEEMLDEPDARVEFDRADLVAAAAPVTLERTSPEPRTQLETELTDIFRRLLGRDELDVRTSFFEMGGTSLLAVRAMRQIRRTLRVAIPVETIFSLTSVEKLARAIESPESVAGTPDSEGIRDEVEAMWRNENFEEDHS
ncbi:condensation domain-containing protein [Lentzea kentuckyensis]|uniref:condensation domain-containing protein n=1 Tax=Lentzea kentuckyensis TaxID=360086 RepID=UPI000A376D10|nr:condensation domain-containing protein [Lentzea kentuckyensis]